MLEVLQEWDLGTSVLVLVLVLGTGWTGHSHSASTAADDATH